MRRAALQFAPDLDQHQAQERLCRLHLPPAGGGQFFVQVGRQSDDLVEPFPVRPKPQEAADRQAGFRQERAEGAGCGSPAARALRPAPDHHRVEADQPAAQIAGAQQLDPQSGRDQVDVAFLRVELFHQPRGAVPAGQHQHHVERGHRGPAHLRPVETAQVQHLHRPPLGAEIVECEKSGAFGAHAGSVLSCLMGAG
ncbi:MAG: hypothetical protein R3D80_06760 [Paracoccaceae bacterium]